jgi:hypothetical protein
MVELVKTGERAYILRIFGQTIATVNVDPDTGEATVVMTPEARAIQMQAMGMNPGMNT